MNTPGWKRAVKTAESVIGDVKKLRGVIEQAASKMETHSDALKGILDDLQLIFRLARAWLKGDYKDVSKKSLVVLVGALVYFLMPLDAIPDFIPGLGFMDDVTVVGLALAAVKSEVEKFRDWEIRVRA
ncbi:MAG TPA: YkvA family protein [Candidatus Binatia bacterium]|jgi:uncharacterized membrane protein YkvA (DUF1232 family)